MQNIGPSPPQSSSIFTFRHFPQLDGLRGVSILLVIAGHVLQGGFGIPNDLGALGVLLFFVLSGFLITGLLDREKQQTGNIRLSTFYFRRVLRLFPALFCFLAVLSLMIKVGLVRDTPWYAVVACIIYVRNIWGRGSSTGHIWSLSIEEQFYIFWPLLMRRLSRRFALRVAITGAIAISVFRMVAIHFEWFEYWTSIFYERSWFRFDSILVGCTIALLLSQLTNLNEVTWYFSRGYVAPLLWSAVLTWTIWGEAWTHVWYITVQMILAMLIVLNLILCKKSPYLSVLSHPLLGWFGRISYSWYLWQQLFTVFPASSGFGLRTFPLNVLISLLIAVMSHRLIERPFLELKDRLGSITNVRDKLLSRVPTPVVCEAGSK